MGNNNVDSATSSSKIITDLKAFQKDNPEAKNMKQLNTIFSAMDKNGNQTIDDDEGTLFYFSDGTISATKCEKTVGDDGREIEHYKMFMGADDNGVYEYGSDGKVKKSIREQDDGSKFEFGYTKDNQIAYKKYTDKEGNEFLLSPTNKKVASIEKDGSIRTFHNTNDSFEGTMDRLGIINDEKAVEEFKKANPQALNMKHGDRFTLTPNDPMAMPVVIPKSILEKYEVVFYNNEIGLKPKAEGAPKEQPWDKEEPNAARDEVNKKYAEKHAVESTLSEHKLSFVPPDPFKPVSPVVKEEEMTSVTQTPTEPVKVEKQPEKVEKDDKKTQPAVERREEVAVAVNPGGYKVSKNKYQRVKQSDGTFVEVRAGLVYNGGMPNTVPLTTKYDTDGKTLISRETVQDFTSGHGVVRYDYEQGKAKTASFNVGKCARGSWSAPMLATKCMSRNIPLIRGSMTNKMDKSLTVKNSYVQNSKGKVILSYHDGKFYNAKGKIVDEDKAYDIIDKQKNYEDLTFVQEY